MQLNEKSKRILNVILHEKQMTLDTLTMMLPYSRRTVEYELERIQEWLVDQGLSNMTIDGTKITLTVTEVLIDQVERAELVWSDEERELVIAIYGMTRDEFLSSFHFQHLLGVSKYTAQESLNAVKRKAAKFGIDFSYTRKDGYRFNGHFQTITLYLYRAIEELLDKSTFSQILDLCFEDWQDDFVKRILQIEQFESLKQFQFVESHRERMAYFIMIGSRLAPSAYVQDEKTWVVDQVEQSVRKHFEDIPQLWDTLIMLIQSGQKVSEEMDETVQRKLASTMAQVIERFEVLSCTRVIEREALCEKLVLHAKATIKRVHTEVLPPEELKRYVMKEHRVLNVIVNRSLDPMREQIQAVIPESEIMYFTLHFAAHLHQQGQRLDEKMKAIVVCPSGISVSHMLDHILKNQFPDFVFLPPISQRDVLEFAPLVDLIFTTVPLPLKVQQQAHVTLVPTLPTRLEQLALKRQIHQRFIANGSFARMGVNDILEVVKKYATIHQESQLRKELNHLLKDDFTKDEWKGGQPMLNQLVTEKEIQLQHHVSNWQESIRLAAEPLLNNGSIEARYIETMIENVIEHGPYIVLMPHIAIPHARPEDGVNQLGMSVMKLNEPVLFPGDKPVRAFFVLAAIDQTTHLKALAQLTELLGNEQDLTLVLEAGTVDEIMKVLDRYSEEEK
ncbi:MULTISPECIES: PTS sugar transporter subunit IIA [unclassified Exiguobacterium]|uniref:BglG family transcription antiterminator n=1 Tax=unclassified Exiguobacterium TaxID=2644629 RepID=UPI001BEA2C96|nr:MULTISPECIES: PTS sugar transporter subunit IIA [unclassified Exiguobacterium]